MAATMKRDDLIKERNDIIWAMGQHALQFLKPLCHLMSFTARYVIVEEEIRKVTPKPAVVPEEKQETASV